MRTLFVAVGFVFVKDVGLGKIHENGLPSKTLKCCYRKYFFKIDFLEKVCFCGYIFNHVLPCPSL